ncbi:MAG: hypothetical protein ACPF8Y_09470, partial [Flavobacteriales bacterium]
MDKKKSRRKSGMSIVPKKRRKAAGINTAKAEIHLPFQGASHLSVLSSQELYVPGVGLEPTLQWNSSLSR